MMMKYLLILLISLSYVQSVYGSQEVDDKDEPFYQQLSRAIIRFESSDNKPLGTGFFATHSKDKKHFYVITARHVVVPKKPIKARVPSQRNDTKKTEIVELRIPGDKWIFHPETERQIEIDGKIEKIFPVDVAIAKIPGIKDRRIRTTGYCPAECTEASKKNQFLEKDPMPPLRVMVWGFPVNLGFTLEEQRPLVRLGFVAMKAKEPFIRTEGILRDEKVFLLDAPIFPGNSGGPIYSYPAFGEPKLIGLISASNIPLNFAIAEPVSRIAETMEAAFKSEIEVKGAWYLIKNKTTNKGIE